MKQKNYYHYFSEEAAQRVGKILYQLYIPGTELVLVTHKNLKNNYNSKTIRYR